MRYADVIADLTAERDRIEAAIAALTALSARADVAPVPIITTPVPIAVPTPPAPKPVRAEKPERPPGPPRASPMGLSAEAILAALKEKGPMLQGDLAKIAGISKELMRHRLKYAIRTGRVVYQGPNHNRQIAWVPSSGAV